MLKKKAVIVDYGCGNLTSIKRAIEYLNFNALITNDHNEIINAERLILPGVGNFGFAMNSVNKLNLKDSIMAFINSQKPFLGICLGMQLMFQDSEEDLFKEKGLGIFEGSVKKIPQKERVIIPRVGWYSLSDENSSLLQNKIFSNISFKDKFYFIHSYGIMNKSENDRKLYNEYSGTQICTAIIKNNIFLFQFHPEKSSSQGLEIYKNFFSI